MDLGLRALQPDRYVEVLAKVLDNPIDLIVSHAPSPCVFRRASMPRSRRESTYFRDASARWRVERAIPTFPTTPVAADGCGNLPVNVWCRNTKRAREKRSAPSAHRARCRSARAP